MSTEMKAPYGYSPGPMGYMPAHQQPPPSYGYSPAPPVLSQQSSSNVVVMNQPSAAPSTVHVVHSRPNEYLILTIVMMVLCFLHGNLPAFVCLIPALGFSVIASSHNDSGDYVSGRKFGNAALCCNGFVFIYYLLLILAGVAVVVVYFTVGFSGLVGTADAAANAAVNAANAASNAAANAIGDITVPPINVPNCYTDYSGLHCTTTG